VSGATVRGDLRICHVDSSVRPLVDGANEFTIGAGSLSTPGSSTARSPRRDGALRRVPAVLVGRGAES